MRAKFHAIEKELNASYFERRDPIRGLMVGLLSRQHVVFLGPPGTGKSALVEDLCSRIGGHYFKWLLSRLSTPEELFGPVSLKALEQDSYRRNVAGKLPEGNIGFLDEVWKCNSAVLNMLLPILNERIFFNDGQILQVPLQMMVGASNELPEDREELGALWDRFLLRYVVDYIKDPGNFDAYLDSVDRTQRQAGSAKKTTLTAQELAQAQAEAAKVDVSKVKRQFLTVRQKMAELNITVSDRRLGQCLTIVRANAWMDGRNEATEDDLTILAHALWQEPSQVAQVRQALIAMSNPYEQEAMVLFDQATEIYQKAMKAPDDQATAIGTEANAKLKRIAKHLEDLQGKASGHGKTTTRISEISHQVVAWNREVIGKCLGIQV